MGLLKKLFQFAVVIAILGGLGFGVVKYYSFIFSKNVAGKVIAVKRVTETTAIMGSRPMPESQLYSFSLSLELPSGEFMTATSEDRQWAVVLPGQCVQAKFYPYAPWELDKAGTYYNARLLKLADCKSEVAKDLGLESFADDQPPAEANSNSHSN